MPRIKSIFLLACLLCYTSAQAIWLSPDPLLDKYPHISPYAYCNWNPVKYVDPDGRDTVNLVQKNNIWGTGSVSVAKGNDVFNLMYQDGTSSTYEFSEGKYGERVNCLNLEDTGDEGYTLGVYHVSGAKEGGTGFYITPGGGASNAENSGRRIVDGSYPLVTPFEGAKWQYPGVGGNAIKRGSRFHYSGSKNPRSWTTGCFVLFPSYSLTKNGKIQMDPNLSMVSAINFAHLLGGVGIVNSAYKGRMGVLDFPFGIQDNLILKSIW